MPSESWKTMMMGLGEQYGSLEEHPFLSPGMKNLLGAAWENLKGMTSNAPAGDLLRLAGVEMPRRKKATLEDLAMDLVGASAGTIKGLKAGSAEAKALRKIMADEFKARKTSLTRSFPGQEEWLRKNDWFVDVLSGTWYHGRRNYPERGMTFVGARQRGTNLGEPSGVSVTSDFLVADSFAKATKKHEEIRQRLLDLRTKLNHEIYDLEQKIDLKTSPPHNKLSDPKLVARQYKLIKLRNAIHQTINKFDYISNKVGRVFPRYGENPAQGILPAWKAPGTEWAQNIIKDAYEKAVKKTLLLHKDKLEARISLALPYADAGSRIKDILGNIGETRQQFNQIFTEELRQRGVKGFLYSPARFGERELRMLEGSDLMMLDKRSTISVTGSHAARQKSMLRTLAQLSRKKRPWLENAPKTRAASSLREIYKDVDLVKIAKEVYGNDLP